MTGAAGTHTATEALQTALQPATGHPALQAPTAEAELSSSLVGQQKHTSVSPLHQSVPGSTTGNDMVMTWWALVIDHTLHLANTSTSTQEKALQVHPSCQTHPPSTVWWTRQLYVCWAWSLHRRPCSTTLRVLTQLLSCDNTEWSIGGY